MAIGPDDFEHVLTLWGVYISAGRKWSESELRLMMDDCRAAKDGVTLRQWAKDWCLEVQGQRFLNWGHFAAYLRKRAAERNEAAESARPKMQDCVYCGSTGWMGVCAPLHIKEHKAWPRCADFNPPLPWADTRVYRFAVPCICTRGQRVERKRPGFYDHWHAMRRKHIAWFNAEALNPGLLVSKFMVACEAARVQAEAQAVDVQLTVAIEEGNDA